MWSDNQLPELRTTVDTVLEHVGDGRMTKPAAIDLLNKLNEIGDRSEEHEIFERGLTELQ